MTAAGRDIRPGDDVGKSPTARQTARTMMALGEAAGVASALVLRDSAAYADVDVAEIRGRLGIPAFEEKAISVWGMRS